MLKASRPVHVPERFPDPGSRVPWGLPPVIGPGHVAGGKERPEPPGFRRTAVFAVETEHRVRRIRLACPFFVISIAQK